MLGRRGITRGAVEERLFQPQCPEREAFGVAARTEVARLAREGEEILVRTRVTAHARGAVLEHAAGEELVGHLADDGAPVAVRGGESLLVRGVKRAEVVAHEPKERRGLRAARLVHRVDTRGRRGRARGQRGHRAQRSGAGKRRAYVRRGETPSPACCVR